MKTPFEMLDCASNTEDIHPFGCLVWNEYLLELRAKFGERAQQCVYLGSKSGKAYLYRIGKGRVLYTTHTVPMVSGRIPVINPFEQGSDDSDISLNVDEAGVGGEDATHPSDSS
ncbi:hypothetical protein LPJ75_006148 [Coemansia sp. RSA 2598]|nr:hypothetical protein LPJ75_006148 [Coemansia sp. RSA 2598]